MTLCEQCKAEPDRWTAPKKAAKTRSPTDQSSVMMIRHTENCTRNIKSRHEEKK